jgi:uncharacterized membrane protein YhiD involved in acid resistance
MDAGDQLEIVAHLLLAAALGALMGLERELRGMPRRASGRSRW